MENEDLNLVSEDKRFEKTRKLSIIEGASASVMSGAGDSYITPYAIELQANNFQVGLLSSLGGFIGPISQIFGSKLMEKYPRKRIVVTAVIFQASMWIALLSLGFIFLKHGKTEYLIPLLICAYVLYALFGSFGGPAWFSLMGDAVPQKIRGKYFSKRNRVSGIVSIAAASIAAILLYYTKEWGLIIYGFIILFAISAVFRYISAYFLSRHYVPKIKLEKGYYFSFWQFIKKAPSNNFGRFTLYIVAITLSVNIAGPFFAVYMWNDLQLNPLWFTAVNLSATIFSIIFIPFWGKFADRYGNREMLKIGSVFISILPALWLFSKSPIYLILVPQLISGIGWAAFNLAASNFIYDAVTVPRRGIVVAYYSILNGAGVFIGAALGGIIAQYSSIQFMNVFLFIFLISAIARGVFSLLFIPHIKEVCTGVLPAKKNPLLYLRELRQ
ncbi:MFS transporter [Candidatus Pacearchaeota archaeon]|nr:MFS transporter [Candidatus Pacearchaeota archaeon]